MTMYAPSTEGLDKVLSLIGRASTPSVSEVQNGISLVRVMANGTKGQTQDFAFFGVIGWNLRQHLSRSKVTFMHAIPGDSAASLPLNYTGIVLIDRLALREGPWIGADLESGSVLREEAYELCRTARLNGVPVWFVDDPSPDSRAINRLKSACDVVFPYTAQEDFEEGAPVSDDFKLILSVVTERFEFEDVL